MMPDKRFREDYRLARRAAAGRAAAWEHIVDLYGERIFNLALQFSHDRALAEDLTQDVFLRLFRNLEKYRGDVPLVAWTLRLSRNLCIDQYRHTRREREATFLPEERLDSIASKSDPRDDAERRELLAQVRSVLPRMSEDLALVIELRDLQGLSYSEISALLNLPIGTLKSRLSRGRRDLIRRVRRLHASPSREAVTGTVELGAAPC